MEPILEEDANNEIKALSFQMDTLKEEIFKRDNRIQELQEKFEGEFAKRQKLTESLEQEEQKNKEGSELIRSLTGKLEESNGLIRDLKERLQDEESAEGKILTSENAIEKIRDEMRQWKARCEDLEATLAAERDKVDYEKREHEQVKFKLSQSEELLRSFRDTNPLMQSENDDVSDDEKYQNIIAGLKASIDIQSERNIELHQQLQLLKKDSDDAEKLTKSLQDEVEKDKKLIDELNAQNSREFQRNEKLKADIQRLKRDIDSWKKIQTDMKAQYQELRLMYDGVCKHADEQKKEMLEMKMVSDKDKRAITRHKDDIEKLKIRSSSLKQTYEDLKEKYDENVKALEDARVDNRVLTGHLQNSKKTVVDLTSSNKDLKKRSEFNQKELMEKHKVLLQSEEKLKDMEYLLEEKELAMVEAKATVKEANEKAEKNGQEAINKERDLMDRITLVQDLQDQIRSLDDSIKEQIENEGKMKQMIAEKDKAIDEQKKVTKEKELVINELEQRILEMENKAIELMKDFEKMKNDLEKSGMESNEKENVIVMYQQQLSMKNDVEAEVVRKLKEAEEELDIRNEDSDLITEKIANLMKMLQELRLERNLKNVEIARLGRELEEEQKRTHLQDKLLKEMEGKVKGEDHKLIDYQVKFEEYEQKIKDLQMDLNEKERLMEELKRELEESEVIQVYLDEINVLNKSIAEERSLNEQLQEKLEKNSSEETLRIEEEKKEVMLQMTKELKREKQTRQTLIADLKEDIRVLEINFDNEKEKCKMVSNEMETIQRKLKNDRESFLEHIEELQVLYSKEKENRLQAEEKAAKLTKQVREAERSHVDLLEKLESTKVEILTETESAPVFDQNDGIEDLKQELLITKEHLREANHRIYQSSKDRENEKLDFQILCTEKDELISSLRKENMDLKKGWEKERVWMDENTLEQTPRQVDLLNNKQMDEKEVLVSQNEAIQVIKKKIEVDFNLNNVLPFTEQADEKRLDILYKKSLKPITNMSKKEAVRVILEKFVIVLLMSPLAYLLSCEMPLSIVAILMPLAFIVYHRPWKNDFQFEKILTEAVNGLSTSLAAERAENENLRRILDELKKKEYAEYNFQMSSSIKRKSYGQIYEHFSNERNVLTDGLERSLFGEQGKNDDDLLRMKEMHEVDRLKLQRQQSFIDKLEVILHEKEIKSGLGKFWGYEELKMAINRLAHEREIDKNRSQSSDDDIAKKISDVLGVASYQSTSRKLELLATFVIISVIAMILFSVQVSSLVTMAVMVVIASASLVFGLNTWKTIKHVRNELNIEKGVVDAQKVEIDELSVILDREHDVVNKQKQAIEALEERLNDEYRKNKENQVTITKLTWVCQESEQIQCLSEPLYGKDNDLQKLAEDHARDKLSVFRSMQKQLKEHSAHTDDQRKTMADLKKATSAIVEAAEKQISMVKSSKESKHADTNSSLLGQFSIWQVLVIVFMPLIGALLADRLSSLVMTLVSTALIVSAHLLRVGQGSKKEPKGHESERTPHIDKDNINLPFSFLKLCLMDGAFITGLVYLNYHTSFSSMVGAYLMLMVLFRLLAHFLYKRTMRNEWKDVLDDLGNQVKERTELIEIQTQEIQTLKTLLEVERGYSRQADKLIKESKAINDEGFVEITDGERLRRKNSDVDSEEDHLVNYELDELKIFFEEEQRANVQLRKTLAEVQESKRKLTNDLTNLTRKLEIELRQRKDVNVAQEEELFLKDRIDELMEDLEAEQRTKQELNAQLIEERSSRELKEIELHDLKEKFRDEKHANQNLRQQVSRVQTEPERLQREIATLNSELEEERLATQRHNITITEAFHEIREKNLILRRQINDGKTNDSHVREQVDNQQEAIERIQTILDNLSCSKKALKYQDILDELQELRLKISASDIKPNVLLDNLELEREKNKILEEAVEELQRQQVDQRKMFEDERRRSIEMARQLSGEDIPMMLQEETYEELEDKRGVLYWLGTNGGLTEWKNPGESGLILINRSSYGHGRATDVANRRPSWCSTSNKPNQWWKIDFGEKRLVVPNAYSLRHGWSGNAGALRNWVFEGSLDGKKWLTLRQHINDETIDRAYGFGYWKINNEDEKSFRFVRVRQTGLNSNGRHALRLCGIEVYGRLVLE